MEFREERLGVNGVDTAVLVAGDGPPLVYLHGAGTVTGFDAMLPLAEAYEIPARTADAILRGWRPGHWEGGT